MNRLMYIGEFTSKLSRFRCRLMTELTSWLLMMISLLEVNDCSEDLVKLHRFFPLRGRVISPRLANLEFLTKTEAFQAPFRTWRPSTPE